MCLCVCVWVCFSFAHCATLVPRPKASRPHAFHTFATRSSLLGMFQYNLVHELECIFALSLSLSLSLLVSLTVPFFKQQVGEQQFWRLTLSLTLLWRRKSSEREWYFGRERLLHSLSLFSFPFLFYFSFSHFFFIFLHKNGEDKQVREWECFEAKQPLRLR